MAGDFERDFLNFMGDLEPLFDVFFSFSGEGERFGFFLPSAMLINFAWRREIATAASLLIKKCNVNIFSSA